MTNELLPDFPPGPLDVYRKQATFDWRKMRIFVETEDILKFKIHMWNMLENDPVFQREVSTLTLSEQRHIAVKRTNQLINYNFLKLEDVMENIRKWRMISRMLRGCYDGSINKQTRGTNAKGGVGSSELRIRPVARLKGGGLELLGLTTEGRKLGGHGATRAKSLGSLSTSWGTVVGAREPGSKTVQRLPSSQRGH
uniref:Uncharacterized protein n=1 Tax=Timema tahoe TaxID=61484 RepID=A0A7R9FJV1_9NEOP|nr:unnamed protein product [Timema tahoe]